MTISPKWRGGLLYRPDQPLNHTCPVDLGPKHEAFYGSSWALNVKVAFRTPPLMQSTTIVSALARPAVTKGAFNPVTCGTQGGVATRIPFLRAVCRPVLICLHTYSVGVAQFGLQQSTAFPI